jgi:hypothetical protein
MMVAPRLLAELIENIGAKMQARRSESKLHRG